MWIEKWEPEDPEFWASTGRRIANRNLGLSILTEHIGFSIWSLWSVMVLFMGPKYGFTVADKFLLTSTPTLVGRDHAHPVQPGRRPVRRTQLDGDQRGTAADSRRPVRHRHATLVRRSARSCSSRPSPGVGGGNFASSMTNINAFFPDSRKGWALGLNAGGGNLGVAVIQIVALIVLGTAGALQPRIVLWVYLPLIVIAGTCAALFMDNLRTVRNDTRAMREVVKDAQCWVISALYIGTFGSFIGYSFAFGLVLQNQFHRTPVQAATVTFLGPLLGSLSRPVGGWLADRLGGAKVTFANFALMAVCAAVLIVAANTKSLPMYTVGFIALFIFSGVGNGSTYKMIPGIYHHKALVAIEAGAERAEAMRTARRRSGALIGIAGAIGALGGVGINLAFRASFAATGSGTPAVVAFVAFYAVCFALTWLVYLRAPALSRQTSTLATARV